ncbi:hypothetical protein Bca52824_050262 [Brassica carinata]|uniref:Uncharacterized protein n=1 Tax=Brassica carinata TaxID=52824 RepID=A0A8X7RP59_BRACI|nr:hypothetical protein Bca52824_050262 [Brassica carinata]
MGRAPCCEKVGIKRGRWTAEEDQILSSYIQSNGEGSWRSLPKNAGLKGAEKSCRLRWVNYLRSDLRRGNITPEEEELVVKMHSTLGNRWSLIASHLPGRTDNEIKIMELSSQPKTKKTSAQPEPDANVAINAVVGEEALMMELSGAEADLGPRDDYYYGACHEGGDCCNTNNNNNNNNNNLMSINGDNGVCPLMNMTSLIFVGRVRSRQLLGDSTLARGSSETSNLGNLDCLQPCRSVESFLNYEHQVNDALTDEFIDWECVWQEGNKSNKLCDEKEASDPVVSWLLNGDDEATIGQSNCENLGNRWIMTRKMRWSLGFCLEDVNDLC